MLQDFITRKVVRKELLQEMGNLIGLENMNYKSIIPAKNGSFKCQQKQKKVSTLRQLSPSLLYFVLSETLHYAIIKFGNYMAIVSRL